MIKAIPLSSPLFGPNTPEWQLWITLVFTLISVLAALGWGYILEHKYTGPYTLSTASTGQKWRWAAIIMFWQTLMIPILGLVQPILSPVPGQWPAFPLFCSGLWIVIFPLAAIWKRWDLERQLKSYKKMDKMIKSGFYQQLVSSPLAGWSFKMMNLFSNAERKKFFETGYLRENGSEEEIGSSSSSWFTSLMDHTNSVSSRFCRKYPDENILFASMATMLEVDKKPPISWLPRFYQRRGVVIFTEKSLFFKSKFLSLAVFISIVIALIPLIFSAGSIYLIYFLYRGTSFESFISLIPFIVLLIPVLLFLMATLAFGLSIFHYRPHEEQISFQNIQNVEIGTAPGVIRRYPSLTLITTTSKTFKIVFAKSLPDEVIQRVKYD